MNLGIEAVSVAITKENDMLYLIALLLIIWFLVLAILNIMSWPCW